MVNWCNGLMLCARFVVEQLGGHFRPVAQEILQERSVFDPASLGAAMYEAHSKAAE